MGEGRGIAGSSRDGRPVRLPARATVVWAVGADHPANYLVARDCPRAQFAAGPYSTAADLPLHRAAAHGALPRSRRAGARR
ncbi:MAG TPA: hypothetical protein VFR73_20965 [Hyphomicrobiaceae bacterium]|nr:hypothetical protein [Hyphomicrobiaceae bacterium]